MNISDLQAQRKAAEREPIDWDTYRAALLESGMVEESRKRRESETLDDKIGAYPAETWLRQVSSVGELQKQRDGLDLTFNGTPQFFDTNPSFDPTSCTPTLVDELWLDAQRGRTLDAERYEEDQ